MNDRKAALLRIMVPIGVVAALAAGCSSKPATDNTAATQAQAAQSNAIQQNPNVPPEAKAALARTMQGKNEAPVPRQPH